MIPRMRTVALVFAGVVVFMSCLAATGCGDNLSAPPTCEDTATELCDAAQSCGNLVGEWADCYEFMLGTCEQHSPEEFTATCEALNECTWGPVDCA